MKTLLKIVNAALIIGALTGCTVLPNGQEPDWFQYQSDTVGISLDSLSECGPTVARNFLHWQTGIDIPREQARAMYHRPVWWWPYHIRQFINRSGGSIRLTNWRSEPIRTIQPGEKIIAHINHTHFVTASLLSDGYLIVHDTNSGISKQSFDRFMSRVSQPIYLKGGRCESDFDCGFGNAVRL